MPRFSYQDQELAYTEYGSGPKACVLLHGQLLSQRMHEPLARALASKGHRAITLDLLGHGESSRPPDMWRYSMSLFAEQVVALLDHLELPQAVVGGTSLGANVTLEVAALAPGRARGLVVEMPVLDRGVYGAVVAFTPLLSTFHYAMPVVNAVGRVARVIPRGSLPWLADVLLDLVRQDHVASAAILQGLFMGRIAPHRSQRRTFAAPTLVIGHPGDPIHPLDDAQLLAEELPNARLVEANSILELRLHPERLTEEIAAFLDACWQAPRGIGEVTGGRGSDRARGRRTRSRSGATGST